VIDIGHRAKWSITQLKSIEHRCDRLEPAADLDHTTISSTRNTCLSGSKLQAISRKQRLTAIQRPIDRPLTPVSPT
jgi:hypothetical protein